MAQLKDLIVTGASRFIGDVIANQIQITTLKAPSEAGGNSYEAGTSGQALFTNGTSAYWGNVSTANYYHTTGSWSGTTYTATANGGAGELKFTLPAASTSAAGVVQLSSATNSTSTALAATASAVKAAYDLAASKTANTGTVTSITINTSSPLTGGSSTASTTTGSWTIGFSNQNANTVLAGPASGNAAAPTFRALTVSDISNISTTYKPIQTAVTTATDNNTTNTRFVSGVTQDANGVITVVTELCPVVEVVRLIS